MIIHRTVHCDIHFNNFSQLKLLHMDFKMPQYNNNTIMKGIDCGDSQT